MKVSSLSLSYLIYVLSSCQEPLDILPITWDLRKGEVPQSQNQSLSTCPLLPFLKYQNYTILLWVPRIPTGNRVRVSSVLVLCTFYLACILSHPSFPHSSRSRVANNLYTWGKGLKLHDLILLLKFAWKRNRS